MAWAGKGTISAAAGLALALVVALWSTRFYLVPTTAGLWRGVSDPPSLLRVLLSLLRGIVLAVVLSRRPLDVQRPVLVLLVAGAPLIPVLGGHLTTLLAFQGPVLVLLLGAVVGVVVLRAVSARGERPCRLPAPLLLGAAFVFYAVLATRIPGAAGPQGDEPHYLAMAHNLLTDRDLDLTDEFESREYSGFFAGPLTPHTSPSSPPGRIYSSHSPGLPLLILPAYALGGYPAVRLFLSSLAALLVHRLVRECLGAFVLDGPPPITVEARIRRVRPHPGDSLLWAGREIGLGRLPNVVLHVPLAEGIRLGPTAVVAGRLRAPGAWIGFSSLGER